MGEVHPLGCLGTADHHWELRGEDELADYSHVTRRTVHSVVILSPPRRGGSARCEQTAQRLAWALYLMQPQSGVAG